MTGLKNTCHHGGLLICVLQVAVGGRACSILCAGSAGDSPAVLRSCQGGCLHPPQLWVVLRHGLRTAVARDGPIRLL